PMTHQFQQVQVVHTGTWWSQWYPISSCYSNGYSNSPSLQMEAWSYTYTYSYSGGLTAGLADSVLGIILGKFDFNFGYTWSKSESQSSTFQCTSPAHGSSQIWYQQMMGWSDSQTQTCTTVDACTQVYVSCGAWSAYQRSDWPLHGDPQRHVGCSQYKGNLCQESTLVH
ncbi:hypothetical protein V1508DRAFT_362389, partial [Lipomyces doorenjongii]|uniref:uncharacterized protein n=1 Tax=Lipomyces doorenjongii TaxID=383834 RepID=UPI0034CE64CE